MNLEIWINVAILIAAIFLIVSNALNVGRTAEDFPKNLDIAVLFLFGYIFLFIYALLGLVKAVRLYREEKKLELLYSL